jgi:AcrR family transcriptional regulator
MKRPSEITRDRILKTAVKLFAESGYEATSIRTLAAKAHVNQAAINYHFKKDGLYREVLRDAIHALTEDQLSHAQETQAMPRERALGEFVRQQLRPLSARDDVTRYIHILNWEAVQPTAVYRKLVSEEAAPRVCGRSDAALHARGRSEHADHGRRLAGRSVQCVHTLSRATSDATRFAQA